MKIRNREFVESLKEEYHASPKVKRLVQLKKIFPEYSFFTGKFTHFSDNAGNKYKDSREVETKFRESLKERRWGDMSVPKRRKALKKAGYDYVSDEIARGRFRDLGPAMYGLRRIGITESFREAKHWAYMTDLEKKSALKRVGIKPITRVDWDDWDDLDPQTQEDLKRIDYREQY